MKNDEIIRELEGTKGGILAREGNMLIIKYENMLKTFKKSIIKDKKFKK